MARYLADKIGPKIHLTIGNLLHQATNSLWRQHNKKWRPPNSGSRRNHVTTAAGMPQRLALGVSLLPTVTRSAKSQVGVSTRRSVSLLVPRAPVVWKLSMIPTFVSALFHIQFIALKTKGAAWAMVVIHGVFRVLHVMRATPSLHQHTTFLPPQSLGDLSSATAVFTLSNLFLNQMKGGYRTMY